jgi:hypothetical protein
MDACLMRKVVYLNKDVIDAYLRVLVHKHCPQESRDDITMTNECDKGKRV